MTELIVAEPGTKYQYLPVLVVDSSVLAAFVFRESNQKEAAKSMAHQSLHAPWLIDYEMVSVALKKANSGLADIARQGIERLAQIRITRHRTKRQAQWQLAKQQNLSAYDAAYLQLAIELNAPLATYDRKLGAAARRVLGRRW